MGNSKLFINNYVMKNFKDYLIEHERSAATVAKYVRDVRRFGDFTDDEITVSNVLIYKQYLSNHCKLTTANSVLSSLNAFFTFAARYDLKVSHFKVQRKMFRNEAELLSREEYLRMLNTAKRMNNYRLTYIMQTICATGIRVSELQYITAESVQKGVAQVRCKGKMRTIIIPKKLALILNEYCASHDITSGAVFVTAGGVPVNRSNIWRDMKRLCVVSGVPTSKVYPHNLRHLFAQTYYDTQHDIVKLADILGHSNVQTTRIYTVTSYREQADIIDGLGLL